MLDFSPLLRVFLLLLFLRTLWLNNGARRVIWKQVSTGVYDTSALVFHVTVQLVEVWGVYVSHH